MGLDNCQRNTNQEECGDEIEKPSQELDIYGDNVERYQDKKPPNKNPLDINHPCQKLPGQKPPRENILFRNFITFVFRISYGKEISIWFLAVKYIRHGPIK